MITHYKDSYAFDLWHNVVGEKQAENHSHEGLSINSLNRISCTGKFQSGLYLLSSPPISSKTPDQI